MTYQGARARPIDNEMKRFYSVSKIRLDAAGWATHVLWNEINAKSNGNVGAPFVVPVADVVDAIHAGAHVRATLLPPHAHLPECVFEVVEGRDGTEAIDLVKRANAAPTEVVEMKDLASLPHDPPSQEAPQEAPPRRTAKTFAVSQVALDDDGRVIGVLWGRVDTVKNAWAEPEVVVPVADVVAALQAGDQIFALFPSIHGHLPDRQFAQANYDGGRQTIVLIGPTSYERDIHDMDRIAPAELRRAGLKPPKTLSG
jgi:hypothetical protein